MTTNSLDLDRLAFLTCELEVNSSESCFHNAACYTEDNSCACVIAHDILIPLLIRETVEHDTCTADHSCELTCCENCINIRNTVDLELLSFLLELLSNARHDGYNEDILRIDALLLCPVRLDYCALHLVRRLAGRKVIEKISVVVLCIVDPSR